MPPPPTVTALPSLRARRCEPRSTVVPKLVRVTVWREGGYCVTFDGGGSTASVLADVSCASSYAGARHGVARGWLSCYLRRRRLIGAALASTLACVTVWREGGCCATFDGGGSTVAVLADAGSAACCFISAACAGLLRWRASWCGAKVVAVLPRRQRLYRLRARWCGLR